MRQSALIGALALAFAANAAQSQVLASDADTQVNYVREQLAGSGFKQVPAKAGGYRFEGSAPTLTVVLLEPKRAGGGPGRLSVLADHPDAQGKAKIRESALRYDTPEQLASHVRAVKAGFRQTQAHSGNASKCPFTRLMNTLVAAPARSEGVVGAANVQPVSLSGAEKAARGVESRARLLAW